MKVVLVNPSPERFTQKWDKPGFPPLGLGYLAASLRKAEIEVEVLDAKLEELEIGAAAAHLVGVDADIFGLTAMTHEVNDAAALAARIKDAHPDSTVIIGGCHSTALPDGTLSEFDAFDIAVSGEGEETICEIVQALRDDRSLAGVKGAVYREGGSVIVNDKREMIKDLDSLPTPAWDLFPRTEIYPVMTARGCPFRCVFCMRVMGNRVRYRDPEKVVDELGMLISKFNAEQIYFYDETFTLHKKRIHHILDLLIQRGYHKKIRWLAQTRVTECDEELFKKMAKAGCFEVNFGIESGNQEILNRIGKNFSLELVRKVVTMAKNAGIGVANLFILGHPGETKSTVMDTINLAVELNSDRIALGMMVPYPGTEVARMAQISEGGYRLVSRDWSDYNKYLGNALEIEGLSRKQLERLQAWGYLKFYLWNFRLLDLLRVFFKRWNEGVALIGRIVTGRHRRKFRMARG